MYAKAKKSLPEMYSFTVCLWIKSNASPGVGTPFSYAVPGQANELVLIEWGNNPMEILINDKVMKKLLSWKQSEFTRFSPLQEVYVTHQNSNLQLGKAAILSAWMSQGNLTASL